MSTTAVAREYRLTRPGGLGFFRRRSAAQFAICCAGVGLALLALVLSFVGIGGRVALALCGFAVVGVGAGRTFGGEDFVSLIGPLARFATRRVTGRQSVVGRHRSLRRRGAAATFFGDHAFRSRITNCRARKFAVASVSSPTAPTVRCRACCASVAKASSSQTTTEKDARLAAFGEALASLVRDESPVDPRLVVPPRRPGTARRSSRLSRRDPSFRARRGDRLFVRRAPRRSRRTGRLLRGARHAHRRHRQRERNRTFRRRVASSVPPTVSSKRRSSFRQSSRVPVSSPSGRLPPARSPGRCATGSTRRRANGSINVGVSLGDLCGFVTPENGFPLSVEEHRSFIRDRRELPPGVPRRRVATACGAGGLARRLPL